MGVPQVNSGGLADRLLRGMIIAITVGQTVSVVCPSICCKRKFQGAGSFMGLPDVPTMCYRIAWSLIHFPQKGWK